MLDVYRKFYRFTGEPFRLGPDYRFSLHHDSYANAKAYLEYAIFQGEGFVTITGGPGTGKTTLISEILSAVDKGKIEVSTLTSTQMESRDLLHMVAHSFGIESGDTSKANLLLEIESFLVRKIHSGQRAILIVDEAQGLSEDALEELRLLANLQYEYQLLLQIVLVGQEQLLELIQQPAMEHLRQRMVAATSLEPLDLDETINYIEHRLSRVAWKGDPGIDEGALRLVYGYSGGVPRRINLIMNRLFLYGGMDEKHQYTFKDMKEVIKGLVEEFLLPPDPLIGEADVEKMSAAPDAGKRPRYLPREPVAKPPPDKPAKAAEEASAPKEAVDKPEPGRQKADEKARILSPATTGGRRPPVSKPVPDMDVGSARRIKIQPPAAEVKATEPTIPQQRPDKIARAVVPKAQREDAPSDDGPNGKKGGKGPLIALLLLAGAGSAYLLLEKSTSLDKTLSSVTEMRGLDRSAISEPDSKPGSAQQAQVDDAPAEKKGQIDRAGKVGTADHLPSELFAPEEPEKATVAKTTAEKAAVTAKAAAAKAAATKAAAEKVAAEKVAAEKVAAEKVAAEKVAAEKAAAEKAAAEKAAAEKAAAEKAAAEKAAAEKAAAEKAAAEKAAAEKAAAEKAAAEKAAAEKAAAEKAAAEKAAAEKAAAEKAAAEKAAAEKAAADKVAAEKAAADKAPVVVGSARESQDDIAEARRIQLRQDAEQRFSNKQVNVQAKVTAPSGRPLRPTVAKAVPSKKKPVISPSKVKQTLLQGHWSSAGKPASLLPSESTSCREQSGDLACVSVPQNVKTQYGLALYKVETKLSKFSPEGHFELAYRTLVRLIDGDSSKRPASDDAGWQVTEYSMSCTLADENRVSCLDGKGITREYRRVLPRPK